jgi:cyanophycinase
MLALVGSGEYLPSMEPVDRKLLERLGPCPRVVCLPTAAGTEGPDRIGYWSRLGVEYFERLGARPEALPVIDRQSADDPTLAAAITKADFVYLSGGKPDYLYRTLDGTRSWEAILLVLAGGGLLAGCSAGAMVLGERFFGFPGWHTGFDLVPGVTVVPHFDEIPGALSRSIHALAGKHLMVAGIEANTALVKNGSQYEVLGAGGVTLWRGSSKMRYTAGTLPAAALAATSL